VSQAITGGDSVSFAINFVCDNYGVGDVMPSNVILAEIIGVGLPQLRESMAVLKTYKILDIQHGKRKKVISDPLGSEEHY